MNYTEMVVFIVYLLFMLSIGIWFFYKNRQGGEKTYFLGGRQMGPWVTALSAGASDMSAWVLMGLPTSIYALGLGQAWISIGLLTGYSLSWIFQAPRLRRFSIVANDAITIPQYLSNRFLSKSHVLQVICAIVFLIAYTIYSASSIKACGTLFNTVIGIDQTYTMYVAAFIIIGYTFLGGFSAVCWTDFYSCKMRYPKNGFHHGDSNPHHCSASIFMAHGIPCWLTITDCLHQQQDTDILAPVRIGNRSIVAVLFQGASDWRCQ